MMQTEFLIEEFLFDTAKNAGLVESRGDWIVNENAQKLSKFGKLIWSVAYQEGWDDACEFSIMKERG